MNLLRIIMKKNKATDIKIAFDSSIIGDILMRLVNNFELDEYKFGYGLMTDDSCYEIIDGEYYQVYFHLKILYKELSESEIGWLSRRDYVSNEKYDFNTLIKNHKIVVLDSIKSTDIQLDYLDQDVIDVSSIPFLFDSSNNTFGDYFYYIYDFLLFLKKVILEKRRYTIIDGIYYSSLTYDELLELNTSYKFWHEKLIEKRLAKQLEEWHEKIIEERLANPMEERDEVSLSSTEEFENLSEYDKELKKKLDRVVGRHKNSSLSTLTRNKNKEFDDE